MRSKSFIKELPETDEFHEVAKEIPLVKKLIETGYTGRKGKGGFYRMKKTDSGKVMEAIDLQTGDYSLSKKIDIINCMRQMYCGAIQFQNVRWHVTVHRNGHSKCCCYSMRNSKSKLQPLMVTPCTPPSTTEALRFTLQSPPDGPVCGAAVAVPRTGAPRATQLGRGPQADDSAVLRGRGTAPLRG